MDTDRKFWRVGLAARRGTAAGALNELLPAGHGKATERKFRLSSLA